MELDWGAAESLKQGPTPCNITNVILPSANCVGSPPLWFTAPPQPKPEGETPPAILSVQEENKLHKYMIKFERMSTAEYKWNISRMRAKETREGWIKWCCLIGPKPGPPLPDEEWPGKALKRSKKPGVKKAKVYQKKYETAKEKRYKEGAFRAIARGGNTIGITVAIRFARHMGYAPSQEDEKILFENICGGSQNVTYEQFDMWTQNLDHPEDQDAEELSSAFKAFDKLGHGRISAFAAQTVLACYGEPLDVDEINAAVKAAGAGSGDEVDYNILVQRLVEMNSKPPNKEDLKAEFGVDLVED